MNRTWTVCRQFSPRPHQVLRDIVIGILLEQGKGEHVADHEPGRKRPGPHVPLTALRQDLIHKLGAHPLGEHSQPHVIRQPTPRMHAPTMPTAAAHATTVQLLKQRHWVVDR
jgi:hypothetical protein